MNVTATDLPFELKTSGSAGLYDSYIDELTSDYDSAETTAGVQGVKWKLTKNVSEMENIYSGDSQPDLENITRLDSDKYGLYPGDSGSISFTVVPKAPSIDQTFLLDVTGYKATFDDDLNKTDDALIESEDEDANTYTSTHILFFYIGNDNKKHLLTQESFEKTITEESEYTIYWVWPSTLKEILEADIAGLDTDAAKEVRRAFFEQPGTFLKAIGEESFESIAVEKTRIFPPRKHR